MRKHTQIFYKYHKPYKILDKVSASAGWHVESGTYMFYIAICLLCAFILVRPVFNVWANETTISANLVNTRFSFTNAIYLYKQSH